MPGFLDGNFPNQVCHLKHALHGLKQAPHAWFDMLGNFLLSISFFCSFTGSSLFICHSNRGTFLLLIQVDNVILTGDKPVYIELFVQCIGEEFAIKDVRSLKCFLDIEVHTSQDGLFSFQSKYAGDILSRSQMTGFKLISILLATKVRPTSSDNDLYPDPTHYRSIVGALQ